MKKIASLLVLFTFCLSFAQSAWADERMFVVDEDGKTHELNGKGKKKMLGFGGSDSLNWEEIDSDKINSNQWSPAQTARITPQSTVELDFNGSGQFVDSGLRPPPPGMTYRQVKMDTSGNFAVSLGGGGKGFNYKIKDMPTPIIANRMEWAPMPFPVDIVKMEVVPNSNKLLIVGSDQSLYVVDPAALGKRQFDWEKVDNTSGAKDIAVVDGKVVIWGDSMALREISDFDGTPKVSLVELPDGVKASDRLITSSSDSISTLQNLAQQKKAAIAAKLAAQTPAVQTPVANQTPVVNQAPVANQTPVTNKQPKQPATLVMDDIMKTMQNPSDEMKMFVGGIEEILNDGITTAEQKGELVEFIGRDTEAADTVDVLARMKGKNPVLLGEPGVGKTTVAEIIAQMANNDDFPPGVAYDQLRKAIVVQTTAGKISGLAKADTPQAQQQAMEMFLRGLKEMEAKLARPIILFVDEMHTLSEAQNQALKPYLDSASKGIKFLGATTNNEFGRMIKDDDALRRRLQGVMVPEFDEDMTLEVLKKSWVPKIEKNYNVKFDDDSLKAAISEAKVYIPTSHRPEAPFKLLQDVAIKAHRRTKGAKTEIPQKEVFNHIVVSMKSPLNPYEPEEFDKGLEKLKTDLHKDVVEQEHITDKMVDMWRDINEGGGKKSHRTILVAGPTGAGKTFSGQRFAKRALGSTERLLEIDCTKYDTGGHSLNSLLGAPPGIISSDKQRGLLPEFLDGKGKGQNVIVLNEFDKASPDLAKAIMEMLDSGKLQGGDGKTYYLGKSLVVITTNKGDDKIYPRNQGRALTKKEIDERKKSLTDKRIREFFMEPDGNNLYDTSKQIPAAVLQRIDAAVAALPPSEEGAAKVALTAVENLNEHTSKKLGYKVKLSPEAAAALVEAHYVPEDGVRRVVDEAEKVTKAAVDAYKKQVGKIAKGSEIEVSFHKDVDTDKLIFTAKVDGQEKAATWELERFAGKHDGINSDQIKLMRDIDKRLATHVKGQDEMVNMTARALRVKAVNPLDPKPTVVAYLGPTGTGKTELMKAIAQEKYGDAKRLISFNMGNVKSDYDFNNIFSPPVGIAGSEKPSPFEKFLNDFPEGGVIGLDEIGNMGNGAENGPGSKQQLLMKFYDIFDEGKWRSPHGKVYDLSKYTFGLSSNEGQEIMQGLPSDDLRIAAWKDGKDPANVRQILRKHGWPEALIARMKGNIALSKPLIESERVAIADKLIGKTMKDIDTLYGIEKVDYSPDFHKIAASSFFTHAEGARKLRDFSENNLVNLVSDAVLEFGDKKALKGAKITFDMDDNYFGKVFHKGITPPKREVAIKMKISSPLFGEKEFTTDITDAAAQKRLTDKITSASTAYHEAGHSVLNDSKATGEKLAHVTIKGDGEYGGYARYEADKSKQSLSRDDVVKKIAKLLGGMKVEERMGFPTNTGWSRDLEMARDLAQKAVTEWGLAESPLSLPTKDGKVVVGDRGVQAEIQKLLNMGQDLAEEMVTRDMPEIRAVANALYKKKSLDGDEHDKIVLESRKARVAALKKQGMPDSEIAKLVKVDDLDIGNSTRDTAFSPSGRKRGGRDTASNNCGPDFASFSALR